MYAVFDDENSFHRKITNAFNEYALANNLDIYVDLNAITPQTSTTIIENYGTTIEAVLKRKQKKYDVLYYYSAYSQKYGEHLLNLREYLPEETIKGFDEGLLKGICSSSDDKLVGIVIYIY